MKKEEIVAKEILDLLGGVDNLTSVEHCATRLRLILKDKSYIKENGLKIEEIDGVKGQFYNNGQYQIILGTGFVNKVYDCVKNSGVSNEDFKKSAYDNLNFGQKFTRTISDVFLPIIPVLVASGLFLGLTGFINAILVRNNIELNEALNTLLLVLNATAFDFLPALVVWSVVKKFGGSPVIGIVLGLMLVSPILPNAYEVTSGAIDPLTFTIFGVDLNVVAYQGSILPAIAVGIFAAYVEKNLKKVIPNVLDLILTPFLTLLISLLVGLFVFGPILHQIEIVILHLFEYFITLPYGIGGFIVGFLNQIIVVTGMHHIFITIETGLIAETGVNPWNALMTGSLAAQGAAALAVGLKIRNKKQKSLAISAAVPAFLGITEPAIFGVNLPKFKPFVFAVIGGGFAGMLASILGIAANGLALTVIPGTLLYIANNEVIGYILVNLTGAIIAFVLTIAFYKEKEIDV